MRKIFFLFFPVLFLFYTCPAQEIIRRDSEIEKMVSEVNADSLRSYIQTLVGFGTRSTLSSTTDPSRGIGAARRWVLEKFRQFAAASHGRLTTELDQWTQKADGKRVDNDADMANPMAWLRGSDTSDHRIFIISGHLDSRATDIMNRTGAAPGANDDGSGAAAVIECARVLSTHSFPATILFVTVSGEEQGLLGSEHLANRAKAAGWQIEAVLNNDIMGSNNSSGTNIIDNTRVRVFSEGLPAYELEKQAARIRGLGLENDGNSRQLARYIKETGERYVDHLEVVPIYRNDRFLRGGDHTPFVQNGFTAVRITEMNENFEHQHQDVRTENSIRYGDLPEFMDFEYLRKNTALNLACLANLAKAPARPEDVKVSVRGLSNYTDLSWTAPPGNRAHGFYVLMRETYQGLWQKKFFTKDTHIHLPYSKDNYFFAVQSVSEEGNESLAVVPGIGR